MSKFRFTSRTTWGLSALLATAALVLAPPAAAAPPSNDNRVDAEPLPTFPDTAHGTTAEATVERLDPQVSECGRIEGTVWYRIDAAPDGRIVVTVTGDANLGPVVRIYRREPSAIREVDCGTAAAGGTVVASFETVRGAGYLVLVGRRPGAADGEFDLRAELFLPPANDRRADADPIGPLPKTLQGTTLGATGDESDGGACGLSGGTVWFRIAAGADGRIVLRLTAAGELDAAVAVFERVRSQLERVDCAPTDRNGEALLAFETRRGATYLIVVGQRRGSDPGDFTLNAVAAEAAEKLVGRALPRGGVRSAVHGLTDVNDVWSVQMRAGGTYVIAFSSADCASAKLRSPRARSRAAQPLLRLRCRAFTLFTPGPEGGGRYTLEVEAADAPRDQRYRLRVVAASPDDIGVGLELAAGSRGGTLAPSATDLVDVYHFDVPRLSDVRLELTQQAGRSFRLVLLRDTGGRIAETNGSLRRRLERGRYVAAVRGTVGERGGRYRISLLLRDVTSTSVTISGRRFAEVTPGTSVFLASAVSPTPAGGTIELQIDRFDPLTGWHFHRMFRVGAGSGVTWTPPARGRWRVRATFRGTARSSPSRSGYSHLVVAEPIG